jgi:hypothetical protein
MGVFPVQSPAAGPGQAAGTEVRTRCAGPANRSRRTHLAERPPCGRGRQRAHAAPGVPPHGRLGRGPPPRAPARLAGRGQRDRQEAPQPPFQDPARVFRA